MLPGGVYYCDSCSRLIPPEDVNLGNAIVSGKTMLCRECAAGVLAEARKRSDPGMAAVKAAPPKRPKTAKNAPVVNKSHTAAAVVILGILAGVSIVGTALIFLQAESEPAAFSRRALEQPGAGASAMDVEAFLRDPSTAPYEVIRRDLTRLLERNRGTERAGEIQSAISRLDAGQAAIADKELESAGKKAFALAADGQTEDALALIADIERSYSAGPWLQTRGAHAIAAMRKAIESTPAPVSGREIVLHRTGDGSYLWDRTSSGERPVVDTLINSSSPDNEGMQNWFETRVNHYEDSSDHTMIRFDLPGLESRSVAEARLEIYCVNAHPSRGLTVTAYPLLKGWSESSRAATYSNRDQGIPWNSGFNPSSFNSDPASTSDFDSSWSVASHVIREQWAVWDVTPVVRRWLDGSMPNNGLVLITAELGRAARFFSSNHDDAELRPRLVITLRR